jgi:hypothetical protein
VLHQVFYSPIPDAFKGRVPLARDKNVLNPFGISDKPQLIAPAAREIGQDLLPLFPGFGKVLFPVIPVAPPIDPEGMSLQ